MKTKQKIVIIKRTMRAAVAPIPLMPPRFHNMTAIYIYLRSHVMKSAWPRVWCVDFGIVLPTCSIDKSSIKSSRILKIIVFF